MKKKAKRICLGEGEAIGHKHVLASKEDIRYDQTPDKITFMLNGLGVLTHDEHDRMVLEEGVYHSYNQVEFNPLTKDISRVFD
jgi:hypothetical protein